MSAAFLRFDSPMLQIRLEQQGGLIKSRFWTISDMKFHGRRTKTNKVSKGSKGSADLIGDKVERQDGTAGTLRGAHDRVRIDHRLRIGRKDHTQINEHIDQRVNDHPHDDADDNGNFNA